MENNNDTLCKIQSHLLPLHPKLFHRPTILRQISHQLHNNTLHSYSCMDESLHSIKYLAGHRNVYESEKPLKVYINLITRNRPFLKLVVFAELFRHQIVLLRWQRRFFLQKVLQFDRNGCASRESLLIC